MLGQSNSNTIAAYIKINNEDITVTQNGIYEAGEEYTGLGTVTVNVGSSINNQDKTVDPTTSQQSIVADSGYSGLGTVTVNAVTSNIDQNIQAQNIVKDVTILGVTGSYEGQLINNQNKTASVDGTYVHDAGYTGLGTVTVTAGAAMASSIETQLNYINSGNVLPPL